MFQTPIERYAMNYTKLINEVESLDPIRKYKLLVELSGYWFQLCTAIEEGDWGKIARCRDELNRRADIAYLDMVRKED